MLDGGVQSCSGSGFEATSPVGGSLVKEGFELDGTARPDRTSSDVLGKGVPVGVNVSYRVGLWPLSSQALQVALRWEFPLSEVFPWGKII